MIFERAKRVVHLDKGRDQLKNQIRTRILKTTDVKVADVLFMDVAVQ